MTLLLIAGQLWREIPSTGGWYTLDEIAPGEYAYRYSDDPSQGEPSPAHPVAGGLARNLEAAPEEPGARLDARGSAGQAREGT
jgi:hypothetical protein